MNKHYTSVTLNPLPEGHVDLEKHWQSPDFCFSIAEWNGKDGKEELKENAPDFLAAVAYLKIHPLVPFRMYGEEENRYLRVKLINCADMPAQQACTGCGGKNDNQLCMMCRRV